MNQALKELMADQDVIDEKFEQEMEAFTVPGYRGTNDWEPTPKQLEIMRILKETPMLTDWLLQTLVAKVQEINTAILRTLYTDEQIKELVGDLLDDGTENSG